VETRGRKAKGPSQDGSQLPKGEFILFEKVCRIFTCLLFLFLLPFGQILASEIEVFDLKNVDYGIVTINKTNQAFKDKKAKVMIQKNNTTYFYDINESIDTFPLQMGSGTYKLTLLEYIESNKYKAEDSEDIQIKLKDENISFLQSASPVCWHKDGQAAKMAAKLSEEMETDEQKAYAIYEYITKNIKYDKSKIAHLRNDYIPSVDEVLSSCSGICFDYAALYAAMLRSINIPTKLVKGYKGDIDSYHAWNEVYLPKEGWVTIDTTYDAIMIENGKDSVFKKDRNEYKKEKEY